MLPECVLGLTLLQAPGPIDAVREARAAFEATRDAQSALTLGVALARAGATGEALEVLAEARRLAPSAPEPYLVAALVLRDANRQQEGAALLEKALSRGPATASAPVYEELGFLLLSLGSLDRARDVGRDGLELFPESPRLKMVLGLALALADSREPESDARAAALLAEALEGGAPDPGRLHRELGSLLVELGRTEEGIEHLRRAVALEPDSPEARFRLGTALRSASDLEGARAELERFQELQRRAEGLEVEERKLRSDLNEAQRLALSSRLLASLEKLGAIVAEHPDDPRAYVLQSKVLASLGRDEEALGSIKRAKALAPPDVETYLLEGRFLLKLGRFRDARSALAYALTLQDELAEAHELAGVAEANLERHERAVAHFEKARALGADSDGLTLNLAASLRKLGRDEEADRLLARPR